ncbi:Tetratricopeptide-like helical domain protein [Rutstroemia sp. NJR-2017a WRK4]|nr:Tetratricopeptide-like helical domain protein [Rutstroemia sp. NJR-2017a WRK4]
MKVGLIEAPSSPMIPIIVAIALVVGSMLWRRTKTSKTNKTNPPLQKLKCRRIQGIPFQTTKESLIDELRKWLPAHQSHYHLTLARSSSSAFTATVNSFEIPDPESFLYTVDETFIGITPLFDSDEASIDIIAVPGLGNHSIGSFKAKDKDHVWIRDFLPKDIPSARILVYGYDTSIKNANAKHSIPDLAKSFLMELQTSQRPIIFVAHSLGGLLVKEALYLALRGRAQPHNNDFFRSSYALIFFGVPNLGLKNESLREIVNGQLNQQLIHDLHLDNESEPTPFLRELGQKFMQCCQEQAFQIISFYEQRMTKMVRVMENGQISKDGLFCYMVTRDSACRIDLGDNFHKEEPLDRDHSDLVKFSSQSDESYVKVLFRLKDLVENTPSAVENRFASTKNIGITYHGNMQWKIPRATNNLFTGRTELISRIQKALHCGPAASDEQKRFVITGLGGQGKSEICLQVASQMREEFWGVFWVNVSKASTAESDFITIAKLLGRSVESVSDALYVLASIKQPWLLILDNADDPNFDYQIYFPSGTHGAILMTSRVSECKEYSPEQFEALEGLGNEDSKELLLKAAHIPKESWRSYNDQAEIVVQLLGSHTLALTQAGAYIAKGRCQLHQYPQVYQRQRKRLMQFRPKQAQSRYHDVYATFEASAEVLEQSKSEAAKDALDLLAILSMLDSAVLPLKIFQSAWDGGRKVLRTSRKETNEIDAISRNHVLRLPGFLGAEGDEWDPFRLIEASSQLISLSLVMRHGVDGLVELSMHPLAHAWAKDRQDPEQQGVTWIAAGCVLTLSGPNPIMWQTQERRLLPHIQSYLDIKIGRVFLFGHESIVIPILLRCGWILLNMRQDTRLSHLLEDMFSKLSKHPEEPSKEFLPLYDLQAGSLLNIGKNKIAVALLQKIVKIQEITLAEDHPDRLASQHALARACQANGQVKEAVVLLQQVVKIRETTLAEDHPDRLNSQYELSIAYRANRQVKEAVILLQQVVKIRETTLAEDNPDRLNSQHELAIAYRANGQVKEAVVLLEQVVKIREAIQAEDHPHRLASQQALARAYRVNGQVKEAVALLQQVVKIRETTLAEDNPDRLNSQDALAMAYQANGQIKEAVALLEQVVKIRETIQAEDHPSRLTSQQVLARAYKANGQVKEAVALLEQVVRIMRSKFPKGHPSRVISEDWLSDLSQQT